jgi:NAD(P)-dependent dehydrogenase (short-subunit alcohol dehydrogenase family)
MAHKQHPIGTGFSAAATADEVLTGIDLTGKNVIVTGGHAGLGLETTRALARAGASVTVGSRDPERAALATGYDARAAYAQAKKANVLLAVELDRRFANEGIRAYAVHPGVVVGTSLNSSAGAEALRAMGLIDAAGQPIIDPPRGKKTVAQGGSTIVFAATSPLVAQLGGVYLKDNDIAPLDDEPRPLTSDSIPSDAASHSIDPESARRLWELSERLLGF